MRSKNTAFAVVTLLVAIANAGAAETFGNFHTIGVVLDPPRGVRAADVAEVRLFELGEGKPRRLLDPVPVAEFGWFAVSVFDLKSGTSYDFRAEFLDAGGKLLGSEELIGKTRPEPGEPPEATAEIHVAPAGDDASPGSALKPKKTIAAAIKAARAGTHVILHEGVYHESTVGIYRGGTSDAPLVIRSAEGERAVLDGSDPAAATDGWKDIGGGYFSRPHKGDVQLICAESTRNGKSRRMYRITKKSDFETQRAGQYRFDQFDIREAFRPAGDELTIYCPYFKPDGDVAIRIGSAGGAFELSNASHVIFADLTFRYYGGQAIYVNDSSDVTIRRCTFEHINVPIAVKRASDRLLVEKCRFFDDCARWGFLPKSADGADYSAWIETGAVYVHHPFDGRGFVFRDNTVEGLFDGVHLVPSGASPKPRTSEIDCYRNTITNVCDDFLEIDGFSRNVRVFDNKMQKCLSGISIAQAVHGPTYIVRNIIAGSGESTGSTLPPHFEGYPVKTNGGDGQGTTGWAIFYHNTAITAAPQTNAFRVQVAKWRRLVMANNIWAGTRDGFVFWRDTISPIDVSHDIIFAKTGSILKIKKATYSDITAAGEALPSFSSAIAADPQLANAAEGDYRLSDGSPAIDAGTTIPGINDRRFSGFAPDIGAVELER